MEKINIFKDPNCLLKSDKVCFNKDSYIVSLNKTIIGYFNLSFNFIGLKDAIFIDYELLENFRNKGLGNYFYKIIEDYAIDNFEFEEIVLLIHYKNESSKKIANKNGFQVNYDYCEIIQNSGEIRGYSPFTKTITKNKKKNKSLTLNKI